MANNSNELSEAQLAANRANAQHSTGPKTDAGKLKSCHNAVKTALTGQTVLLPTDDIEKYNELGQSLIAQYQPATFEEEGLVQSLIDTEWRLRRIFKLENGIYGVGREELVGTVPADLLETRIYMKYERNLKNLHLQESRLNRQLASDMQRLQQIQSQRRQLEAIKRKVEEARAKQQQPPAETQQPPAPKPANGFVFTNPAAMLKTDLKIPA